MEWVWLLPAGLALGGLVGVAWLVSRVTAEAAAVVRDLSAFETLQPQVNALRQEAAGTARRVDALRQGEAG